MTEEQIKQINSRLDDLSQANSDQMHRLKTLRNSAHRCEVFLILVGILLLFSLYLKIQKFGYFDLELEEFSSRNSDERLGMIEMRLKYLSNSIEFITKDLEPKGETTVVKEQ